MDFIIEKKREFWHFHGENAVDIVNLIFDEVIKEGQDTHLYWADLFDAVVILKAGKNHLVVV